MDTSQVRISDHALERFRERFYRLKGLRVSRPRELLRQYLSDAKEKIPRSLASKKKKRGGKNRQCKFFCFDGWCFVADSDLTTIITIYRD